MLGLLGLLVGLLAGLVAWPVACLPARGLDELPYFSMSSARFKPLYDESESEDDYLGSVLKPDDDDNDFSSLSFGALSSAQKKLHEEDTNERKTKATRKRSALKGSESSSESDSDDSDGGFFEEKGKAQGKKKRSSQSKRSKHAPAEASSKRPVSRIREIPGLKTDKELTLYSDIRFDAAYGKADLDRIRKDYAFLDEYRQKELGEMRSILKDKKAMLRMSEREINDLKFEIQSTQSRMDTLKNRDLATKIIKDHKKDQMDKMRKGEQTNPYFLKKSEQRKMIQKSKFDTMRASQREKVMERKRKRRLGREFKQLEFRGQ